MSKEPSSIYDFEIIDIDGNLINFSKFEGSPLLLVNTASRCGFTPQYKELEELYQKYQATLQLAQLLHLKGKLKESEKVLNSVITNIPLCKNNLIEFALEPASLS